ncbi:hypothetical protein HID58_063187 [Brassica napus]|uniref:Uncharacterized protein n=1 Tax=Brassica napus TaxID=3708 RepID=A0ABQ8A4L9_BRANA|nr:hypothetical protein HID58_063187 [Brassica napus]
MKSLEVSRLHRQVSYRCVYQRRPGNSRLQKKPKIQDNWERRSWTFMFMLMLHRGFTNDRTQNIGIFPDQTSHIWFTIVHKFKLHSIANWSRSPSWLNKPSILPQGQIETILWGLETAYGKLHLYFSLSARKMEELETCLVMIIDSLLNMLFIITLSHSQYLNFFTILILASEEDLLANIK